MTPRQQVIVTLSSSVGTVIGGISFGLTTWGVGTAGGAVIGSSLFGAAAASLMGGDISDVANAAITGAVSSAAGVGIGKLMYSISQSGIQAAVRYGILTGVFESILLGADPVFGSEMESPSPCE